MTVQALSIINRISQEVYDSDNEIYSVERLLDFINAGQLEAVVKNFTVNAIESSVQLQQGIKQDIPTDGIGLIDIKYNTGLDGNTVGSPVFAVDRVILNKRNPTWATATASATVDNFVYDKSNPKHFDVSPPQPASPGYVQLVYAKVPVKISSYSSNITIPDEYENTLFHYGCYRCYSESSEHGNNAEKRNHHYQMFLSSLGIATLQQEPS